MSNCFSEAAKFQNEKNGRNGASQPSFCAGETAKRVGPGVQMISKPVTIAELASKIREVLDDQD
jgi:hypothetical protein